MLMKYLWDKINSYWFCFSVFFLDLRTAFDLLDTNRDGRVTANELQFMLKKLGIDLRDELIEDLMKEASHTGNILFFDCN